MTANARSHGPESTCARTRCAEAATPPHKAGRHLDQRDELYDGPDSTFQVLPLAVRNSARTLWKATGGAPEVVDMAKEILRLRDHVAAVQVDRDHKVREASERALDCANHGRIIADTERQAHHFSTLADQNDRARIALLSFPQAARDLVDAMRANQRAGQPIPSTGEFLDVLDKAVKKTFAAHGRAWQPKQSGTGRRKTEAKPTTGPMVETAGEMAA